MHYSWFLLQQRVILEDRIESVLDTQGIWPEPLHEPRGNHSLWKNWYNCAQERHSIEMELTQLPQSLFAPNTKARWGQKWPWVQGEMAIQGNTQKRCFKKLSHMWIFPSPTLGLRICISAWIVPTNPNVIPPPCPCYLLRHNQAIPATTGMERVNCINGFKLLYKSTQDHHIFRLYFSVV